MFRLKTSCLLAPILALAWISLVSPANAGPLDYFTSVVGRHVFERPAGLAIMKALGADSVDDLVRILASGEMRAVRGELYVRLKHADESVIRLRKLGNEWDPHSPMRKLVAKAMGKPMLADDIPLSAEERTLVDSIVAREMRVNPQWSKKQLVDELGGKPLKFLSEESAELGFEAKRRKLLMPYETFDATKLPVEAPSELAATAEAQVAWEAESLFSRMRNCRAQMPLAEVAKNRWSQRLQAMGIAPLMTALGHGISVVFGGREFSAERLGFDAMFGVGWQGVSTFLMFRSERVLLQWMIVTMLGEARVTGEAVIYFRKDLENEAPIADARMTAQERFGFNSAWNGATSWIPVGVAEMLSGLECLPGSWARSNSVLTRTLISTATTATYFTLRWDHIKQ